MAYNVYGEIKNGLRLPLIFKHLALPSGTLYVKPERIGAGLSGSFVINQAADPAKGSRGIIQYDTTIDGWGVKLYFHFEANNQGSSSASTTSTAPGLHQKKTSVVNFTDSPIYPVYEVYPLPEAQKVPEPKENPDDKPGNLPEVEDGPANPPVTLRK